MGAARSALEIAERVLVARERERATSDETVGELAAVFERLEESMSAVLGDAGYRAMFSRCLRKAKAQHACLAGAVLPDSGPFLLLLDRLRREEPATVLAAGRALLTEFIELLQTLIGDELTGKLLRRTWPAAFASAVDESENS